MYVQLYNLHPMSPKMYEILIQDGTVIRQVILPYGQISEEATELRNKHFRSVRNRDVPNRLFSSSVPLLSCST